jgi:glucosamine-6-phosphate deaminase
VTRQHIPVKLYPDSRSAATAVAGRIAELIRSRAGTSRPAVLGLATGNTPVNVYKELIRLHREEGLDFDGVVTFNLDEYWPIDPAAVQSYHSWMHENFFRHVNIRPENAHLPPADVPSEQVEDACRAYERAIAEAGGIDLQILGIGRSGHIGFNEPGSPADSRTRPVRLDLITRKDAAGDFFGEANVPERAITMGVGTILDAREVCLLAFGEHKADIVRRAVEGPVTPNVAASFLQDHPAATFYLDVEAGADLAAVATPWLEGPCEWDEPLRTRAVIWLARQIDKPLLKITEEDYVENGLAELRSVTPGGAHRANLAVFRRLMGTLTGYPVGREGPRRVVVFSPHPDDDVICMGGTLTKLAEQKHEVHVAYMVSGFLSVFDHDVARYANFVRAFNEIFGLHPEGSAVIEEKVDGFLAGKRPGDVDPPEIQRIKSLVRRTEAVDAAGFCGVREDRCHFLNLPFYNTGKVQKLAIGPEDVAAVRGVLDEVRPEVIFAAGDMSDPHGTHRLCMEALLAALDEREPGGAGRPDIWLYRGAWDEWPVERIEMAVPLWPDELRHKRYAIFRHQSQKDRAMFPGPYDSREFWQRAEDRNMETAETFDRLGLPEYHAVEAFVRYPLSLPASAAALLEGPGQAGAE